jgi:hypothetical protein
MLTAEPAAATAGSTNDASAGKSLIERRPMTLFP